ncbi:origin recognition complex subunit 2 [Enteropsectra breve]|nr:origin recognition complex subunit 2 [Enteropsectra breve]
MTIELTEFLREQTKEMAELLHHFNLLIYGYGSKAELLTQMFPEALVFDMQIYNFRDIIDELILAGNLSKRCASLNELDQILREEKKSQVIILKSFDFTKHECKNLRNIRIIGTIEKIEAPLRSEDLADFNFIFKDFTTFLPYSEEIVDLDLENNKISHTCMIMKNVTERANSLFVRILQKTCCTMAELFEEVKIPLMLKNKSSLYQPLSEFVSHGIMKITDSGEIILNLNSEEKKKILNSIASSKAMGCGNR